MHWAIAVCVILLLLTIFLRMYWLNKNHVSAIIQDFLSTTDIQMSEEDSITLAKKIRKPMWDWHIYLGYILTGLFIVRMSLSFFGKMRFLNPLDKSLAIKEKFKNWVYLTFYLCLSISLFTGLFIEFGSEAWKEPMEEIHVLSIYYLIGFLVIHFTGVLWAEFTDQQGIVSRIISGKGKNES